MDNLLFVGKKIRTKIHKLGKKIARLAALTESDKAIIARADSILLRAIELGKKGKFKIVPEFISVAATENCNLRCLMCPGHTGNTGPKISVEQADSLFRSLAVKDANFGRPKTLDMTAGEPTLNQNLGPIYRLFKDLFPDAKISTISNATIPIKGRVREAFELSDSIGLSMDGATAETFERIRKGSIFKNVVCNVKDIAEIKQMGVNCDNLQILFVAMDQNIHELPEMVRLAHSLGVPRLFAQVSEARDTPFNGEGQNIALTLSNEDLAPFVNEAKLEAKRLGITLSLTSQLQDALRPTVPIEPKSGIHAPPQLISSFESAIKTCNYPWIFAPRISLNHQDGIYPTLVCCHMPHADPSGRLDSRPEFKNKSILEIFNSDLYWDIRSGLLDGTLAKDACEDCQYFRLTQWTGDQLRELDAAVNRAELLNKCDKNIATRNNHAV